MEYSSATEENEISPFAMTPMDLEDIMLHKNKSIRKRQKPYDFIYVWNLRNKQKKTDKQAKDKTLKYKE